MIRRKNWNTLVMMISLLMLILLSTSCTKRVAPFAMTKNTDPIGITDLKQLEKNGVKKITRFIANFHQNLRPELPNPKVGIMGTWNVLVVDPFDQYRIKRVAVAYLKKDYLYTPWCNPALEIIDLAGFDDTSRCLYVLTGQRGTEYLMSPGPDGRFVSRGKDYDYTKLDDPEYRRKVFSQIGLSIAELEVCWKAMGLKTVGLFEEIVVGTERWESFQLELKNSFPNKYQLLNGDLIVSQLNEDEFKLTVSKNPGMTWGQIFWKDYTFAIGTPQMMAFSTASQFLNFGIKRALNVEVEDGFTKITRGEAGELIDVWIDYGEKCQQKKELHYEKK